MVLSSGLRRTSEGLQRHPVGATFALSIYMGLADRVEGGVGLSLCQGAGEAAWR
jgi:hypothetical protein